MGILDIFRGGKNKKEGEIRTTIYSRSDSDFWFNNVGILAECGISVTPENAIKLAAVWACNKAICETVSGLPFLVYERTTNGGKRRAAEHPLYKLLHTQPNSVQTSQEWRECMQTHLNLYGNAYSIITKDAYGNVLSLSIPIHPTQVDVKLVSIQGIKKLRYEIKSTKEIILQDNMFHLKGLSSDGLTGMSPISAGKDSIGLALAAEKFGSSFFRNGYRPSGVVSYPNPLTQQVADNLRQSLKQQAENGLFILDTGAKFDKLTQTADEAQYIETRQHQIEEVCRWFRMPPHKISHLLRSTFSNIEHQSLEYIKDTILPQVKKWEQKAAIQLFTDENYFAEMLLEGELRGDTLTRVQSYKEQWYIGAISSNEIRISENRNPYEGGDDYFIPLNMQRANITDDTTPSPISPTPIKQETVDNNKNYNGKIYEAKAEKEGELKEVLNDKNENKLVENLVYDASQRIAKAEIREIEKIGNNPEKVEAFYKKHYEYINKTLQPFGVSIEPEKLTLKSCNDKDFLEDNICQLILGKINNEN